MTEDCPVPSPYKDEIWRGLRPTNARRLFVHVRHFATSHCHNNQGRASVLDSLNCTNSKLSLGDSRVRDACCLVPPVNDWYLTINPDGWRVKFCRESPDYRTRDDVRGALCRRSITQGFATWARLQNVRNQQTIYNYCISIIVTWIMTLLCQLNRFTVATLGASNSIQKAEKLKHFKQQ